MQNENRSYTAPIALLTMLFFMWGFITVLNDILIPHLKKLFDLNNAQAMLVQFTFFGAYFTMSLPAGWIIGRIGYQKGIMLGLATTGLGALLFYPSSIFASYAFFLFSFFVLASGITFLQVAANPFVTFLGKPEHASSRLSLTQGFNSLGTAIAPSFGAFLILKNDFASPLEEARSVQLPYIAIACVLFLLAALFFYVKLPVIVAENKKVNTGMSLWRDKKLMLGALGIFMYVGAEVAIGSFLVLFLKEKNIANLAEQEAGFYVSLYWGGAMIGRFIGFIAQKFILPTRVLAFNALMVIILILITIFMEGKISMWALLAVGIFNSIMFPTLFSISIEGLGENTSKGSGILVMAIVGGAVVPFLMGLVSDQVGIQSAFFVTLICYFYILILALLGNKINV